MFGTKFALANWHEICAFSAPSCSASVEMAGRWNVGSRRRKLDPSEIEGWEYFDTLVPLLARLKDIGTKRDKAGNRQLFYDQYISLLLLYFFNPTITSLRGLQQASTLEVVQRRLGIRATSLGSFSEAARVFNADALARNPPGTGSQSHPRG